MLLWLNGIKSLHPRSKIWWKVFPEVEVLWLNITVMAMVLEWDVKCALSAMWCEWNPQIAEDRVLLKWEQEQQRHGGEEEEDSD